MRFRPLLLLSLLLGALLPALAEDAVRFATEQLHFLYVWLTREALNYEVIGTNGQVLESDVVPRRN